MKKEVSISLFLDTRRKLKNGKYPVKLRVYTPSPKKQKLYPTKFEYREDDFREAWTERHVIPEFKEDRKKLNEKLEQAEEAVKRLPVFTFEGFEKYINRPTGDASTLKYHYDVTISDFIKSGSLGTADVYSLSQNAIKNFVDRELKSDYSALQFYAVDNRFLEGFERWMIREERSITTISMYLRCLRAIFNRAHAEGVIDLKVYPFKTKTNPYGYEIQSELMRKRALNEQQKEILLNSKPATSEQQRAKDFWFLSYYCYGVNFKDILLWRWDDKHGDVIEYLRAKTRRTRRKGITKSRVLLNDYSQEVIRRYGTGKKYIFDIINDQMSAKQQQTAIKNFTRNVNQHLKELAAANNLPEEISTYWARHTFATLIVHAKAPITVVKDLLGHSSIQQTMTYVSSLEDDKVKEYLAKL